jgi:hypothetical protein
MQEAGLLDKVIISHGNRLHYFHPTQHGKISILSHPISEPKFQIIPYGKQICLTTVTVGADLITNIVGTDCAHKSCLMRMS